jgi:hypothetical protein
LDWGDGAGDELCHLLSILRDLRSRSVMRRAWASLVACSRERAFDSDRRWSRASASARSRSLAVDITNFCPFRQQFMSYFLAA